VAEVGVLNADLLELLTAPSQLLVDVVGRHHGTVGEPNLFPIEGYSGRNFLFIYHNSSLQLSTDFCNVNIAD
jgi:hypothetical protein